jgi:hypothetical protein
LSVLAFISPKKKPAVIAPRRVVTKIRFRSGLIGGMHQRVLGNACQFDLLSPGLDAHDARQLGPRLPNTKSKVRSLTVSADLWLKTGQGFQDGMSSSCPLCDLNGIGERAIWLSQNQVVNGS